MTDEELAVSENEAVDEELTDEEEAKAKLKEAIAVTKEEIGALRLRLTITVPRDLIDERMGKEFGELKRDAAVPGFRKGHAPMKLIQKRFGSDVGDQLVSQLVSNGFLAAVEKEDIKPLGDPLFLVTIKEERIGENNVTKTVETEKLVAFDEAIDNLRMPRDDQLTFTCELELKPDFDLPELSGIPVIKLDVKIGKKEVDLQLKRMRMMRGTYKPVEDGKIEADDMLFADMKMSVDGEVLKEEENIDIAARDIFLAGIRLTGLGPKLTGAKIGDTVAFETPVPDDHEDVAIREKQATFEFKIREIKRLELPPMDDAFLEEVGCESEKELRDAIKDGLESERDQTIQRLMKEQVASHLVEHTDLELPEGLSQRQTERSVARRGMQMLQSGLAPTEVEKELDTIRGEAKAQVVHDLKLFFILEKIAEDREIDIREEQLNAAIAQIAARSNKRFDRVRDELSKGDGLSALYLQLRDEQVLENLLQDAKISEGEPKKKDSPKKKAPAKKKAKKKASE